MNKVNKKVIPLKLFGFLWHIGTHMVFPFMVVYISSSFWLLSVVSLDYLSQAEKEIAVSKAEHIHKTTTIFTQNDNLAPF